MLVMTFSCSFLPAFHLHSSFYIPYIYCKNIPGTKSHDCLALILYHGIHMHKCTGMVSLLRMLQQMRTEFRQKRRRNGRRYRICYSGSYVARSKLKVFRKSEIRAWVLELYLFVTLVPVDVAFNATSKCRLIWHSSCRPSRKFPQKSPTCPAILVRQS